MQVIKGYHTVEDRDNDTYILENAPFFASEDSDEKTRLHWLGPGYYFWVEDMQLAVKWGKGCCNRKRNPWHGYVVCAVDLYFEDGYLLDLVDNNDDIEYFIQILDILKSNRIEADTIRAVILHLKRHRNEFDFPYEAVKTDDDNFDSRNKRTMEFVEGRKEAVTLRRKRKQICLFTKDDKVIRNLRIIARSESKKHRQL